MWLLAFCFEPVVESSWFLIKILACVDSTSVPRNMILSFFKWCLNITNNEEKKRERESKLHKLSVIVELKIPCPWPWFQKLKLTPWTLPQSKNCPVYSILPHGFLDPLKSDHLQSTIIDSDICQVCIILPPPHKMWSNCSAKGREGVNYGVCSEELLRSSLPSFSTPLLLTIQNASPHLTLTDTWVRVLTQHHLFDQKEPMPK